MVSLENHPEPSLFQFRNSLESQALRDGAPSQGGLRISFGIKLVFGLPLPQYRLGPCVVEPFNFTWDSKAGDGEHFGAEKNVEESRHHPITKVLAWRKRLESEKGLTKVQIAREAGLTKSRITHMFMMVSLAKEAQEYLAALISPQEIQYFSVRRLKALAKQPPEEHRAEFAAMQANCARRGY